MGIITIPLIRIADDYPLSTNSLSVRCLADRRISKLDLPAELPGWSVISRSSLGPDQAAKELVLRSTAPDRLLALQLEGHPSDHSPDSPGCRIHRVRTEIRQSSDGTLVCRAVWQLRDVATTRLTLCLEEPLENVKVDRCLVNGEAVSATVSASSNHGCQVSVPLAPQNLLQPTEVALEFTRINELRSWWISAPRMGFGTPGASAELYQQSWQVHADSSCWLLYTNQSLEDNSGFSVFLPHKLGADQDYRFETVRESAALFIIAVPRVVIILVCSFFSFLLFKFGVVPWMRRKKSTISYQNGMLISFHSPYWAVVFLIVAGLLFLFPVTAVALIWGSLPGAVAMLLVFWLERFFKGQRNKQNVFLSPGRIPAQDRNSLPNINNHEEEERQANTLTYCPPSKSATV
jgi:hypothetical protein